MYSNSYPASILSLPMELLQEIVKVVSTRMKLELTWFIRLSSLRLVCKTFNAAVTPLAFSHISITFDEYKPNRFLELLESLAAGAHPGIPYASSLTIGNLCPYQEPSATVLRNDNEGIEHMRHKLEVIDPYCAHSASIMVWLWLGIARLSNVTSVKWTVDHSYSYEKIRDSVISGISKISTLTSFELHLNIKTAVKYGGYIDLSLIPPVEAISIFISHNTSISQKEEASIQGIPILIQKSSDRLRHLQVKLSRNSYANTDGRAIPLLSYLLQKVDSLPSLKSITLDNIDNIMDEADTHKLQSLESLSAKPFERMRSSFSWPGVYNSRQTRLTEDLWLLLKIQNVHLKEITVEEPNESLLEYLQSYTGLQTLTIIADSSWFHTMEVESDALSNRFYRDALRSHAKSLQTLVVTPRFEGKWCFGEHCVKGLASLVNLRHLSICIVADYSNVTYRNMSDDYTPNYGCAFVTVLRPDIIEESRSNYDPLHPACQVLQMAASFPKLELLSITSALPCYDRTFGSNYYHAVNPNEQVYVNVTSYGPLDPSKYKFTVSNGGRYFRLRMIEELGEYRYRLI